MTLLVGVAVSNIAEIKNGIDRGELLLQHACERIPRLSQKYDTVVNARGYRYAPEAL